LGGIDMMTNFRCPYCGRHSNKWLAKCPDCGFERTLDKGVNVANGDIKHNRGSSREIRKIRDPFRGGRNQTFAGESHKRHIKGADSKNGLIKRAKNRRGAKQN